MKNKAKLLETLVLILIIGGGINVSDPGEFVKKVIPVYIDPVTGEELTHPAEGLPLLEINLNDGVINVIADGASDTFTRTAANWGALLDFYVKGIVFQLTAGAEPNDEIHEGIHFTVVTTTGIVFAETIRRRFIEPNAGDWLLYHQLTFKSFKVANADNLVIYVVNESGVQLNAQLYLRGIAI